jgi:hypothetical protein
MTSDIVKAIDESVLAKVLNAAPDVLISGFLKGGELALKAGGATARGIDAGLEYAADASESFTLGGGTKGFSGERGQAVDGPAIGVAQVTQIGYDPQEQEIQDPFEAKALAVQAFMDRGVDRGAGVSI